MVAELPTSLSSGVELGALLTEPEFEPSPLTAEELPAFQAEVAQLAEKSALNFAAPPFVLPDEPEPAAFAQMLTETLYKMARLEGPLLSLLWREFTAVQTPESEGLRAVGEMIAADYDRGIGAGRSNAFHNLQRVAEVLLCAHVLLLLAQKRREVTPLCRLMLLMAALIKDWHHDGTTNAGLPFRLENRALMRARVYFSAGKLPADLISRLNLIVRGADIEGPHEFARAAYAWHLLRETKADAPPPAVPPAFSPLSPLLNAGEGDTAWAAALLRDAMALPQAGLTAHYATLQNARLQDEWAQAITPEDYQEYLNFVLARPRRPTDPGLFQDYEAPDRFIGFATPEGQFFDANIPVVVAGVMTHQDEVVAEVEAADRAVEEQGIDFSMLSEAAATPEPAIPVPPEEIAQLRTTMTESGYFDGPPFALTLKAPFNAAPSVGGARFKLADSVADGLMRLHSVSGPVVSAVTAEVFSQTGLPATHPLLKAAMAVARAIDLGEGVGGAADDAATGSDHAYHNKNHILDLLLLTHLLALRAAQRDAPAASALPWGLTLLAALICHWHHEKSGNRVDGQYRNFYLQDRALDFATPHLDGLPTDLTLALQALVRATDPRDALQFIRIAYNFHIGLAPEPAVPPGIEALGYLVNDPALTTVANRLNDAIYAPFVGLTPAYSARAMVQLGREMDLPIDFAFVRKNLIVPMLSRPLLPGETPAVALLVAAKRVASFTTAEAQALFNPSLQTLLAMEKTG